jgi:hypothetical protein
VFTVRYTLSHYIKQTGFTFKGLIKMPLQNTVIELIAPYFDCFLPVCHDNGSQGRILCVDL